MTTHDLEATTKQIDCTRSNLHRAAEKLAVAQLDLVPNSLEHRLIEDAISILLCSTRALFLHRAVLDGTPSPQ